MVLEKKIHLFQKIKAGGILCGLSNIPQRLNRMHKHVLILSNGLEGKLFQ